MIKRYGRCWDSSIEEMEDGEFVLYADHEADVAAAVAMAISDHAAEVEALRVVMRSAEAVTKAFRELGESTPWTRGESNARYNCEQTMAALDDAIRAARTAKGEL